jgi:FkbM family methyltransferase
LASGLKAKVKSFGEWRVFNHIFVVGEYDLPIKMALASKRDGHPFTFLDLGANVGYFTTRLSDLILQSEYSKIDLQGTLIEASPSTYSELKQRLSEDPYYSNKLTIINGLVGERDGVGQLFETDFHTANSIFGTTSSVLNSSVRSTDVPYIDLDALCESDSEIDILKVDIQGAELRFLENYHQSLLKKVKLVIIELHHDLCDHERCLNILREEFPNYKPIDLSKDINLAKLSVHFFWK